MTQRLWRQSDPIRSAPPDAAHASAGIGLPVAAICLTVLVAFMAGCTTVHESPDSADQWEVPNRFDRDESAEDRELIFVLHDPDRDISAAVHRTTPAFPDPLIPDLVSHRAARLGGIDAAAFERSQSPAGWIAHRRNDKSDRWLHIYAFSADEASYALAVEGPRDSDETGIEVFERLVAGFTPAQAPKINGDIPTTELSDRLGPPAALELEPVDAKGKPRSGLSRDIEASEFMISGHLVREPLTYAIPPERYLDLVIERLALDDAIEVEPVECGTSCAARRWQSADNPSQYHLIAALTDDREALQFRIRAPANAAEIQRIQHQWMGQFTEDPDRYFRD